ncbi:unnamed protein product [Cyprideis torosa]|uniref:Endoplasmic reticulum transmembrane protein n=1 Tax=Cyprideis torosa TaxID=163714 RepID=A0A7R8WIS3_9CRUS|nr:unnamed protein product [Cyprideis torosa]CAG0895007.1 unnamed protein product [Cyprideis torosa]
MMSIQWSIAAGFLYLEMAFICLLMLPWISATTWRKIFKSRFLRYLEAQSQFVFYCLLGLLGVFFIDALREMYRYGDVDDPKHQGTIRDHDKEVELHLKLFRAQRNFYIAGFALYLFWVLKRIISMIHNQANLIAEKEAALKQAASASAAANRMMDGGGDGKKSAELVKAQEELEEAKKARKDAEKNLQAVKSQAENTSREYDRLLSEYEKLEKKVRVLGGARKDAEKNLQAVKSQAENTSREYDRLLSEYEKLEKKVRVLGGGAEGDKKDD